MKNAIQSGISNDLGSGSNVDLCVITRDRTEFLRNIFKTEIPQRKSYDIKFPNGTTRMQQTTTFFTSFFFAVWCHFIQENIQITTNEKKKPKDQKKSKSDKINGS